MNLTEALDAALKVSSVWKCLGGELNGTARAFRGMKGKRLVLVAKRSIFSNVSFDILTNEGDLVWRGDFVLGTYLNLPGVHYAGYLSDEILEKDDWTPC